MDTIIQCAQRVFAGLGHGHSEAIYHAAMEVELRQNGISYEREIVVPVHYRGMFVGSVRLDLIIQKELIVELKAIASELRAQEKQQLATYIKTMKENYPDQTFKGLLINFCTNPAKGLETFEL